MTEAAKSELTRPILQDLVGGFPEKCSLDPEIFEQVDLGDVMREKLRYQVEPGDWVGAYLFVPKAIARPGPAVLCLHQHGGQFALGKSEPVGLMGNPDQFYALELAQRGYVTLVADFLCFEDRRDSVLEGANYERFAFTQRIVEGSTLQAKYAFDAMRGVDYLISRPEVDSKRIGCIGHSLGGQQTLYSCAFDERIAVGVSSCGFASYRTIFRDRINHNYALYVPNLRHYGDVGDVLALIAPRPFLAVAGNADRIFPYDGILETIDVARKRYRAHGVDDRLELLAIDGGHAFTPALREHAYRWLDHWLLAN